MSISGYILIKLAARCNINCSYCYWFKDDNVYSKPPIISDDIVYEFVKKLQKHIVTHQVEQFNCIFHGGEPLLYSKKKFNEFLQKLEVVKKETGCNLVYSITTNGLLIDEEWIELFIKYKVGVSISIDGPREVHDENRKNFNGTGTFEKTINGYNLLQKAGINPSIIAVCNPKTDPIITFKFFAENLKTKHFNILLPDLTYDDTISYRSVSEYYIKMFDFWYDYYLDEGLEIKFFSNIIRVLMGLNTNSDSFGYGPVHVICLLTDGALEPLDVVKIQGNGATETNINIMSHEIEDIKQDPIWQTLYENSLNLCQTCNDCKYKFACGGGHITSRWSKKNGYDNPSIYCDDFMKIFTHAEMRLKSDLIFS